MILSYCHMCARLQVGQMRNVSYTVADVLRSHADYIATTLPAIEQECERQPSARTYRVTALKLSDFVIRPAMVAAGLGADGFHVAGRIVAANADVHRVPHEIAKHPPQRISGLWLPGKARHQLYAMVTSQVGRASVTMILTKALDCTPIGILRASRPLQPIRKDLVIRFRRQRLAREAIMAAKEISVKKYVVRLSGEERERLETLLRKGKSPARRVLKARILLKADVSEAGKGWSDNRIIEALETSPSMVYRVRKQLVEEGFEAVLSRKPRAMPAVARIFDGEKEAKLIALACSKPPKGRARWTLRLLENKVVELGIVDRASDSTIGRALKKTLFSPIAASTGSSRRRPTARS